MKPLHLPALLAVLTLASSAVAQEAPPPPAPPPAAPAPPASPEAVVTPGNAVAPRAADREARRVRTTIDAQGERAVVERRTATEEQEGRFIIALPYRGTNERWEQVCVAPCEVDLDRFSSYRIAQANHVTPTDAFTLPTGESLKLEVHPGNGILNRIANRLVALGVGASITGGILIPVASDIKTESIEDDYRLAGIITASAGALLLAVGIPMSIATQTHVKEGERRVAKPRLTPSGFTF